MKTENTDIDCCFDHAPLTRNDARACAPMQELRIAFDVVDEIEHLRGGVWNPRAALYGGQTYLPAAFF